MRYSAARYFTTTTLLFALCAGAAASPHTTDTTGEAAPAIEIFDDRALRYLDPQAQVEQLAEGFAWAEGPLWLPASVADDDSGKGSLLFSDIPNQKVHRYVPGRGVSVYLDESGFSNGLLLGSSGQLLLMQSRSRQVAQMSAAVDEPSPVYKPLVREYRGKRLNSPNDGVLHRSGILFFTDPPYGLEGQLQDPQKELDFQGVYALYPSGQLQLVDREIRYPNGIALSPDQGTLYVAASDPDVPAWYSYRLDSAGQPGKRELFFSLPAQPEPYNGLPDGLKAHRCGAIFATGPGGVLLLSSGGELLAQIHTPSISANVALNDDESAIYITAHTTLLRVQLRSAIDCVSDRKQ